MGLINNLLNQGELPTIRTEVSIERESLDRLAIYIVILMVIMFLLAAVMRKV